MRTVAAVVALVICVHAGIWSLSIGNIRPDVKAPSPASRILHSRDRNIRITATGRRRSKSAPTQAPQSYTHAIRTYTSTGGVELDPGDRRRARTESHARHLVSTRRGARNGATIQACAMSLPLRAPLQQRQRNRGRQRDDAARREDGRRASRSFSGSAAEPGSGHDRRNWDGLAGPSGELASRSRFHRRRTSWNTGSACRPRRSSTNHRRLQPAAAPAIRVSAS